MKLDSCRAYKQIKSKNIVHLHVDVNDKTQLLEDNIEFLHDFGIRFLDTASTDSEAKMDKRLCSSKNTVRMTLQIMCNP